MRVEWLRYSSRFSLLHPCTNQKRVAHAILGPGINNMAVSGRNKKKRCSETFGPDWNRTKHVTRAVRAVGQDRFQV